MGRMYMILYYYRPASDDSDSVILSYRSAMTHTNAWGTVLTPADSFVLDEAKECCSPRHVFPTLVSRTMSTPVIHTRTGVQYRAVPASFDQTDAKTTSRTASDGISTTPELELGVSTRGPERVLYHQHLDPNIKPAFQSLHDRRTSTRVALK
ncbi:hypothetical protein BV20DRAFT_784135 [Pilatotrama ljubarskyi]|nr:hypothetical protein BV20DRAFT_784135 [Pilatotrama ljubarskyi]